MIKILLVDDNERIRKAIADLLVRHQMTVTEASSFNEMIGLVQKVEPTAVVMDLHMRDQDAVTPEQIKSCLQGLPLVAISIWNNDEARELAKSFGALTLLDKPKLGTELIPAIKQAVNAEGA